MTPKRPKKITGVEVKIRSLVDEENLIYSSHALDQMEKRGISQPEVLDVLRRGNREAAKDKLVGEHWSYALRNFVWSSERNLRVIVALDQDMVIVVTAIEIE